MTLPKSIAILIGATAALAFSPAMAGAAPESTVKKVEISIAGYDLDDPAHAQIVYSKIKMAAKRACRNSMQRQTLREEIEARTCRTQAIQRAVNELNKPQLTLVMTQRAPTS